MNKIRFPIGDWSGDGHGKCDYFFATTPLSVYEDINFYGRDEQGRYLKTPGYGLFE